MNLKDCFKSIGVELGHKEEEDFMLFKTLLLEWNEKMNLTGITDDEGIYVKHFLDSVYLKKIKEYEEATKIIDIGTGAGFPSIPLKIMDRDKDFLLLDSLNKRIVFLNEVIKNLNFEKISTLHIRAEEGARKEKLRAAFDIAVSRAVAGLDKLCSYMLPYLKKDAYMIAMKSKNIDDELKDAKNALKRYKGELEEVLKYDLMNEIGRSLVIIRKK